jgi:serine/threonine protein kinase
VFLATHGVKLLDFGVAHGVDAVPAATTTRLTAPGIIVGTTHYMAPEQITGEPIDGRVDLFAVGAILFECLTGHLAFQLHDTLCRGICETLPLRHETARRMDVPRTPRAYELYLRANQLALESSTYRVAQAMYERCLPPRRRVRVPQSWRRPTARRASAGMTTGLA